MDSLLVGHHHIWWTKVLPFSKLPISKYFCKLKSSQTFATVGVPFIIIHYPCFAEQNPPPAEVPGLWSLNPTTVETPSKQSSWSCVGCRLPVSTFGWPKKSVDVEEIWCELNIQDHTQYDPKLYVYIVLGILTKLLCIGFFCVPMVLFMNLDSVSSTLGSWD